MAHLIDKDAIIAELKKRLNTTGDTSQWLCGKLEAYREILKFLTAIELKKADLEKEIANQYESNYEEYLLYEEFADIAKYFYELGKEAG